MQMTKRVFGTTPEGQTIFAYLMESGAGIKAEVITYGAALKSLYAPDLEGKAADIVLGYDDLEGYLHNRAYIGVIVGRCANRIANARFTLNGKEYTLEANNGKNNLHSGSCGFHTRVWEAQELPDGIKLCYTSPDGESGFPGKLTVSVCYRLIGATLRIEYEARAEQDTILNPTSHTYFNLAGQGDILSHKLRMTGERYVPVDAGTLPSGEVHSVVGTPFDFLDYHDIGERIHAQNEQLSRANGYDHAYVLKGAKGELLLAAEAYEPGSGRTLAVYTDMPAVHLYSGNYLDNVGKNNAHYQKHAGFCLETEYIPDAVNARYLASPVLQANTPFFCATEFRFGVRK